jgi:hypothetical protein
MESNVAFCVLDKFLNMCMCNTNKNGFVCSSKIKAFSKNSGADVAHELYYMDFHGLDLNNVKLIRQNAFRIILLSIGMLKIRRIRRIYSNFQHSNT